MELVGGNDGQWKIITTSQLDFPICRLVEQHFFLADRAKNGDFHTMLAEISQKKCLVMPQHTKSLFNVFVNLEFNWSLQTSQVLHWITHTNQALEICGP